MLGPKMKWWGIIDSGKGTIWWRGRWPAAAAGRGEREQRTGDLPLEQYAEGEVWGAEMKDRDGRPMAGDVQQHRCLAIRHAATAAAARLACAQPPGRPFRLGPSAADTPSEPRWPQRPKLKLQNSIGLGPPAVNPTQQQAGERLQVTLPPLYFITPPTTPLTFSFSSLIPAFSRPTASTVCHGSAHLRSSASAAKFFIAFAATRTYASAPKKKKMPPKKQVEEKKIPLGRPGNNLKSGIVSESPLQLCLVAFSH